MDESIINEVWNKAIVVNGFDLNLIRKDCCGAWIMKSEYGNRSSKYGWEIDHVYPLAKGGDDTDINLRPMHWENNDSKNIDYPVYKAVIQADGNDNIHTEKQYQVNENLRQKLDSLYKQRTDENR
jgi:hypothetical protein